MRLLSFTILLALSGCMYRFRNARSIGVQNVKTIAIPIFRNTTEHPRIEVFCTEHVRRRIAELGKLRLVSQSKADSILLGSVSNFAHGVGAAPISEYASDINRSRLHPTNERVAVSVHFVLIDRNSGKTLFNRTFARTTPFATENTSLPSTVAAPVYDDRRFAALDAACSAIAGQFISRIVSNF